MAPNYSKGERGPNSGMVTNKPFTKERKKEFADALVSFHGQRIMACRHVGVCLGTVDKHLKKDPEFRQMVDEAMQFFRESLQMEAYRRAVEGTKKPLYFQGKRIQDKDEEGNDVPAFIKEYDTPLLVMLLKRHCPEFREKSVVENRNVNVDMGAKDMTEMTPEQREKLRELLDMDEKKPDEPGSE